LGAAAMAPANASRRATTIRGTLLAVSFINWLDVLGPTFVPLVRVIHICDATASCSIERNRPTRLSPRRHGAMSPGALPGASSWSVDSSRRSLAALTRDELRSETPN
jgi:hypothetical protein